MNYPGGGSKEYILILLTASLKFILYVYSSKWMGHIIEDLPFLPSGSISHILDPLTLSFLGFENKSELNNIRLALYMYLSNSLIIHEENTIANVSVAELVFLTQNCLHFHRLYFDFLGQT